MEKKYFVKDDFVAITTYIYLFWQQNFWNVYLYLMRFFCFISKTCSAVISDI